MSDTPLPPPEPNPEPVFDPQMFPSSHRPFRQWLLDHNPCLLVSTVLMLLGCYLVNSALREQSDQAKLVGLVAVINVYEACIIPLGLLLIRRTRGTARDGWWLLLFETLFLVNGTFINVDFGPGWSVPFNLALFALALIKAAVIFNGLKIGLSLRTFGFFAIQLGILYGLPILFARVKHDGVASQGVLYVLWWVVGLLPVAYDVIARMDDRRRSVVGVPRWDLVQQVIRRVYLIVPWVLLVAHVRYSHWAHYADFQWADVSPVFLGLAVAINRVPATDTRIVARILPALAILFSFAANSSLGWTLALGGDELTVSPFHLTFAGMVLAYGYMAGPWILLGCAISLLLAAISYLFHTYILGAIRATIRFLLDMFPETAYGWGIASIALAFILLGIGSLLGLRRTESARDEPPVGDSAAGG